MARRSVSPRAAALALCLSGSPLDFFLRLHFPDAFLVDVLIISSCSSCKGLEGLGVGDKALDLLLDRDDELFSVGCAEGLCSFDFICSIRKRTVCRWRWSA